MAALPRAWRGPTAALLVLAAGLYLGLRRGPNATPSGPPQTYCYQGIETFSEANPSAACFTVSDGRFTDVGPPEIAAEAAEAAEPSPGYVIPGLWDGHGHLLPYGEFLHSVDLFGSSSVDDVRARLRHYLDAHPQAGGEGEWLRGVGWDQMALGGMPTADMLEADERLRGRYILLDRVDVHCVWVSQAVLALLPADVPDVPGGEVVRRPGLGVFCDNAMDLVTALWPRPGRDKKRAFVRDAMRALHRVGLVGMHDAGVTPHDLAMFRAMSETDDWTLRVYAMLECQERNTFCPDEAAQARFQSDMLAVRSVKLFADGALGSWGSAMLAPYTDRPDTSGSLLVNASTLTALTRSWSAAGFQVNIHAIGDLANRLALDAFEAALAALCPHLAPPACQATARFRIEHAQIMHPDDQARLHALGILPSVQPTHATSDMAYAARRLGPARTRDEAYRLRSFAASSRGRPPLVLGSDFPVEPPDPFQGVFAAVARRSPRTGKGAAGDDHPWLPEEALSLAQALEGFTRGPAYGAFLDGVAGEIRPGAFADWVVLDRPTGAYDLDDFRDLKVRETWVAGRRVYARDEP